MKEVFETVFLLAAGQGVLLTLVLLIRKENHTANRILAIATLCLSIDLVIAVYYSKGWYMLYPHFMGISYTFPLLYGPLFYLYAAFVSKKMDRFRYVDWLHFAPVAVVLIICFPVYLYSAADKIIFVNNIMHHIMPIQFAVFAAIIPVQGLVYTFFTIRIEREYDKKIRDQYSTIDLINLHWLKHITIAMIIIWSIVAILFVLQLLTSGHTGIYVLLQLSISILIYSIGYKAMQQPEIFLNPSAASSLSASSGKYERSGLSDEFAEEIKNKLQTVMTAEKPYLENDLTLQKLADRIKISSHNLSEVINSKMNLTYYDFINSHRVEEFKSRLHDPENEKYNLLSIAFDSGFKSKGTFNSIFKKFTGLTPSEYKMNMHLSPKTEKF
ncbi:MAG: AraC family transcriptional regulator [Ignavibacteriae bacterium]|nr:MAG: AraC family transcriptional regulator [Ignavibacteriota bacterium]